jgi:hypothetical protein
LVQFAPRAIRFYNPAAREKGVIVAVDNTHDQWLRQIQQPPTGFNLFCIVSFAIFVPHGAKLFFFCQKK